MSLYSKLLGERLRAIRQQRGLSLPAVQTLSGGRWKAMTVGSYERGDRRITAERLAELYAFYDVPAAELLIPPAAPPGHGGQVTRRLVLPGTAAEEDWLAARRRGITASEIAVILGVAPASQDSAYALYHRKRGDLPEQPDNDEMERGRILEPYIAGKFAQLRPELLVAGDGRHLYAHPDRPWQLATPDRLLCDDMRLDFAADSTVIEEFEPLAVLECKSDAGGEGWGEEGSDDIPVHYRCQVLWQMDVLGVCLAYVACLFLQSWKTRVYELALDDRALEDLDLMRREGALFLDRIEHGYPPDVDWRPPTTAALKRLHPSLEDTDVPVSTQLATRYLAACRRVDAAKQRKQLYENRIREQLGSGHRVTDRRGGQVVAVRQVYPVRAHQCKATTVDKLVPAKARAGGS